MIRITPSDFGQQPFDPDALLDAGWVEHDLPRMTPDAWEMVMHIYGKDNVRILAMTDGRDRAGTPCKRGQLLVRPEGIAAAKAKAAELRKARDEFEALQNSNTD